MSTQATNNSPPDDEITETIEVTIPEQKVITIPLFLKKLWKIVNDSSNDHIIGWNAAGDGFIVFDQVKFVTELLPQYFKHNNLSSFIRQLNFYDFHKVAKEKNEMEFAHPCFLKDVPETLTFITRKVSNMKPRSNQPMQQENFTELFNGVKEIKSKHNVIDNELKMLKQENAALWNEINSLRVKYSKQTKIINKLIHFLISYMHSHQHSFGKTNITVNRKLDQKLLRSTPQLLQIGYTKTPQIINDDTSNFKIPGPSNAVKISSSEKLKNSSWKYHIKSEKSDQSSETNENQRKNFSMHTVPAPENIITENDPLVYNVASPEQHFLSSKSYPIEEIVSDVDPDLEETSVYTVKFPNSDIKSEKDQLSIADNVAQSNPILKTEQIKPVNIKNNVFAPGKTIPNKRKSNVLIQTPINKAKMLKTSQKGRNISIIPKHSVAVTELKTNEKTFSQPKNLKQSLAANKKMGTKSSKLEKMLSVPSPVKPAAVLEDLLTEVGNPCTPEESLSSILSNFGPDPLDLNLQMETEPPETLFETESDPLLLKNESEVTLPTNEGNFQTVMNSPAEFLADLSAAAVDSGDSQISQNTTDEILSSFPTHLGDTCVTNDQFLDSEIESYPEIMLSNLSSSLPQASSPSNELLKYNIVENPRENLGSYLENTQLQLDNIQDLLSDLNAGEFLDLLNCFTVDEEGGKSEQEQNKILGLNDI